MSVRVVPVLEEFNQIFGRSDPFNAAGGMVYFIEKDRQGNERVCRTEDWNLEKDSPLSTISDEFAKQRKRHEGNPQFLALIAKGYLAERTTSFHYDDKGQLIQATSFNVQSPSPYYTTACYRYDDLGRVVLYTVMDDTQTCVDAGKPSPRSKRAGIHRYSYVSLQQPWLARKELVDFREDGRSSLWIEGYAHPGSFFFRADIEGPKGLIKLSGAPNTRPGDHNPEWDLADRNAVNAHTTHFDYYFPHPGPVKLLDDLTKVSQYDRVRVSYVATTV